MWRRFGHVGVIGLDHRDRPVRLVHVVLSLLSRPSLLWRRASNQALAQFRQWQGPLPQQSDHDDPEEREEVERSHRLAQDPPGPPALGVRADRGRFRRSKMTHTAFLSVCFWFITILQIFTRCGRRSSCQIVNYSRRLGSCARQMVDFGALCTHCPVQVVMLGACATVWWNQADCMLPATSTARSCRATRRWVSIATGVDVDHAFVSVISGHISRYFVPIAGPEYFI